MAHYHPASYEAEGRIRQGEQLERARKAREAQAAQDGVSLLSRLRAVLAGLARDASRERAAMKAQAASRSTRPPFSVL